MIYSYIGTTRPHPRFKEIHVIQHIDQIAPDDLEYEELYVHVDEIRAGDIYGGYVITGVSVSEHYRAEARRFTVYTDPAELDEGVQPEEWGRIVLRVDRKRGHKVPVMRPIRRD